MLDPKIFLSQTRPIITTDPFRANGKSQIRLDLPGYYCEILLEAIFRVAATYEEESHLYPDGISRIMKSLKIQADNSDPFIDLPDPYAGRELWKSDYIRAEGSLALPTMPGADEEDDIVLRLPIHGGDFYKNRYDSSEVIARRELSNLALTVTWGTETDIGIGYTIDADHSYLKATVSYLLLQPGISEQKAFAPKGWYPGQIVNGVRIIPSFWQPGTKEAKFQNINASGTLTKNFLNGFYLKDVMMLVFDSTNVLREDIVTQVKIKTKYGREIFTDTFLNIEAENMRTSHLSSVLTGVLWIDLRDIFSTPRSGVRIADSDDLQWEFEISSTAGVSTSTPATIILLYRTHASARARTDIIGKRPAGIATVF